MVAMNTEILSAANAAVLHHRDARGVHTLTLNSPSTFNTLSETVLTALQHALDQVAKDDMGRVVVLSAAGKAFVRDTI